MGKTKQPCEIVNKNYGNCGVIKKTNLIVHLRILANIQNHNKKIPGSGLSIVRLLNWETIWPPLGLQKFFWNSS